jgi:hypothetical protein
MKSARTSLGEVSTRRRSRRAAGPSASARRAASSQDTGARAYQRPGPQASWPDQLLDRLEIEPEGRAVTLCGAPGWRECTWSRLAAGDPRSLVIGLAARVRLAGCHVLERVRWRPTAVADGDHRLAAVALGGKGNLGWVTGGGNGTHVIAMRPVARQQRDGPA